MRPLVLGSCLAVSVTFTLVANHIVEQTLHGPYELALRPPRLPQPFSPPLDAERLARTFGTPLRPKRVSAPTRPLPLKLLGTLDDHAAALLESTTGQCRTLRIGDRWNDVELLGVGHGRVTLRRDGRMEELGVGTTFSVSAARALPIVLTASGGSLSMLRAELDRQLPELLTKLMTGGRVVPAFENGAMAGFRLVAVRPGSLYELLGLRSGDLLETINGQSLSNPEAVMGMMGRLREQRTIAVAVKRDDQQLTWNLTLD